jgi:AraC-like DNA-binding protein
MISFEKVTFSPNASFACYVRRAKAFPFAWHYHPEYEIVAITRGGGRRFIGDHVAPYGTGDLVLISPNLAHSWESDPGATGIQEAVVIQFAPDFLGQGFLDLVEFAPVRAMLLQSARGLAFRPSAAKEVVRRARKLTRMEGLDHVIGLLAVLRAMADLGDRHVLCSPGFSLPESGGREDSRRISKILDYMASHSATLAGQQEVAAFARMSRSGFSRFFRRHTKKSYSDCMIEIRLGQACRLLLNTDRSVTEICFEVGFRNVSNFNRQFRKRFKMSPREYRATNGEPNAAPRKRIP